jgi:hypothetical protein
MKLSPFFLAVLALACLYVSFGFAADVDFSAGSHAMGFGGGGSGGGGKPPNRPNQGPGHKAKVCVFLAFVK